MSLISSLKKNVFSLATVNPVDYHLEFLVPRACVRYCCLQERRLIPNDRLRA